MEELSREEYLRRLDSLEKIVNPKPYTKDEIEIIKQQKREQNR